MKTLPILVLGLGLAVAGGAEAAGHSSKGLEGCLEAVRSVQPGAVLKVEYLKLTDEGRAAYEIEVRDRSDRVWEFECAAHHAQLQQVQRVVDANDSLFTGKAKVSMEDARSTATTLYPGSVHETQYELASDGTPIYEFDIAVDGGPEYKVEVSAVTGEIVEVQIETWQIGPDSK